jgi:hypothetical protein
MTEEEDAGGTASSTASTSVAALQTTASLEDSDEAAEPAEPSDQADTPWRVAVGCCLKDGTDGERCEVTAEVNGRESCVLVSTGLPHRTDALKRAWGVAALEACAAARAAEAAERDAPLAASQAAANRAAKAANIIAAASGPSLGPAVDAILRALPLVECSAVAPERCYCARGTTKPIAEISPAGAVLQVFCSGSEAMRLLVRLYLEFKRTYMQVAYI